LRDQPDAMVKKLEGFRAWLVANPEKLESEALRTRHKEDVLKYLDQKIRDMGFWMDRREEREDAEERARQTAAVLPSEATLDKILRYETALERQLFRAMNQLERLQRRRLGEVVPPPLSMVV
jgi:CRISPR/Cas system-associated endonuclease Cas1